ncbi:class I SAM-dependent methyltransferase [Halopseudomonas pelagia]|uniref:SAM-dependent methyltransferase n=1 Tax=Halopseudomonas pelagia TaxID=553151 RepID=A0AA91U3D4_9GAMM|nr:methyltransferase domain-containing protein [Halopseudomonas pelagia]PCD00029.1 SAM-dependent methyltransferase [Halopseudomonas pelagia]QFY55619.1 class I SAM-dependent methyltransferase [Halopseudomonas pelagia]
MNPYERYVLPRMIDIACGMGDVMKARSRIVPQAIGEVLEIGIGTGLNLQFYRPDQVSSIVGVDPAAQMQTLALRRAAACGIPVEMIAVDVQGIHATDDRFDTIVMTFTLCSITDPLPALREMLRVLKPGGRLLFCEHGLAPDASVRRWQHRLTPIWKPIAGGCHLNRDIPQLLRDAGFNIGEVATEYLPGPRPMTYIYSGWAQQETLA